MPLKILGRSLIVHCKSEFDLHTAFIYAILYKMKIKLVVLSLLLISQFAFPETILALQLNTRDEYLVDVRRDDGDIYRSYITVDKKFKSHDTEASLFLDTQWNVKTDKWEKILFGVAATKSFWEYLYIGQSIQLISGQMLDHMSFEIGNKSLDTTTKMGMRVPFLHYFTFCAFEEYSINLENLREEYNDVGAEIIYRPKEWLSFLTGWRHTDRIHGFDTDYATCGLSFSF